MKENSPNLVKEIDIQVPEAQRVPKVKDRFLKAAREEKFVNYKGALITLSADFSKETLQTRRDW